jgi:hypothetical protein
MHNDSDMKVSLNLKYSAMVARYYVAVRPGINDNHAVHKEGCPFMPDYEKRIYLGVFVSGRDAVKESHQHFNKTKGCVFCSKEQEAHVKKPSKYSWAVKDQVPVGDDEPIFFHQSMFCCVN